jgi:hypothetical protein
LMFTALFIASVRALNLDGWKIGLAEIIKQKNSILKRRKEKLIEASNHENKP